MTKLLYALRRHRGLRLRGQRARRARPRTSSRPTSFECHTATTTKKATVGASLAEKYKGDAGAEANWSPC